MITNLFKIKNILKNIIAYALVFFLIGCNESIGKIKQLNFTEKYPAGIIENFKLISVDSSKVRAILTSPKHMDFSNQTFKYNEFPEGIDISFYKNNKKTKITANYAKIYRKTNIIKLQGNVIITTHDNKVLRTKKLFWDQLNDWIFTENTFTFRNPEEGTIMDGVGIDFSKDFKLIQAHKTNGIVKINDEK